MVCVISCHERANPNNSWIVSYTHTIAKAEEFVSLSNKGSPRFHYWFEEVDEHS